MIYSGINVLRISQNRTVRPGKRRSANGIPHARDLSEGPIKPGAPVTIAHETPSTDVVDIGNDLGAVGAARSAWPL
jgi:hypothetical protein